MASYKAEYLRYMDNKGIKYTDKDDHWVKVAYNCNNIKSVTINVFFDKDGDPLVAFDCWEIIKFKDDKRAAGILLCNRLNEKYRWVKFYVDSDGDLRCQADAIVDHETVGSECKELVSRMVNIIDKSYPEIMKAVWD